MAKILVSGFEAFAGNLVNPTEKLVRALIASPEKFLARPDEVHGVILPVTFASSFERLEEKMREFQPDIVISLGVASGRSASIEIERVAINVVDADIPDNSGSQPRDEVIDVSGPPALFTSLPARALVENLTAASVPAKISNSAGTYVCNFLFYKLMLFNLRTLHRGGFIHVPFLPEQAKTGAPSMDFETLSRALGVILRTCVGSPK